MYDLKQCLGPCIRIGQESSYKQTVRELKNFLLGKPGALKKELFERMKEYSEKKEYEKAKNIYEQIKALSSVGAGRQRKIDEGQVLASLKALLGLDKLPQRIECFDISNLSGSEAVGSMAVFFNGVPDKSSYRRFKIKTVEGIDDYAMMREVIQRRFQRMLEEDAVCPDLVVIDGGKGHLQSVKDELDAMGLRTLAVISIAKQHEHLFSTQRERPYVLAQNSPVLQLIQRLRDEAHRWAINYHRKLHRKKSLYSVLDSIPGVGPVIKFKLLKKYKTIKALSQVSADRLGSIAPLSKKTALRVLEFLKSQKG